MNGRTIKEGRGGSGGRGEGKEIGKGREGRGRGGEGKGWEGKGQGATAPQIWNSVLAPGDEVNVEKNNLKKQI
jgi:hypothetical protein